MATIRQWLSKAEFDWDNGKIVSLDAEEDQEEVVDHSNPILDKEFDSAHGNPGCPRIAATDGTKMYWPQHSTTGPQALHTSFLMKED